MNRANRSDHRGGHDRPNAWQRLEDLPFARVFDDAHDLGFQLLDMLAQEPKFFDQLALFQHQTSLPNEVLDADALLGQTLQFHQLRIRKGTGTPAYLDAVKLAVARACGVGNCSRSARATGPLGSLTTCTNSGNSSSQIAVSLFLRRVVSRISS